MIFIFRYLYGMGATLPKVQTVDTTSSFHMSADTDVCPPAVTVSEITTGELPVFLVRIQRFSASHRARVAVKQCITNAGGRIYLLG